jgi:hypothetical protein
MATNRLTQVGVETIGGANSKVRLTQIAVEVIGMSGCPAPVTLIGGPFTDAEGNVVANGRLRLMLTGDGQTGITNCTSEVVCSGIPVWIYLDNTGNVSSQQTIWGTDVLVPYTLEYYVMLFNSKGKAVWNKSQTQTIVGSPTFNVSAWIPN